jgi:hypothetical protein
VALAALAVKLLAVLEPILLGVELVQDMGALANVNL